MDESSPVYKTVVLGPLGVGKTTLIHRLRLGYFTNSPAATVGANYEEVVVATSCGDVRMNLWDTAGQERFRSLIPTYLRGAHAALVVFDVSQPFVLDAITELISEARSFADSGCRVFLVGNKCDLVEQEQVDKLRPIVEGLADQAVFVSCVTDGEAIEDLFKSVAEHVVQGHCDKTQKQVVRLTAVNENKGCC